MAGHRYRWLIEPWLGWLPLLSLGIFLAVETSQWSGLSLPVVHWYINDLVCIPLFVAASISLERLLSGKPSLEYGTFKLLSWFIIVSSIFEIYLPSTSDKYTADWFDVLFYGLGTGLSYWYSPCVKRTKKEDKAY